jgi:F-type H+-transporting ATPase subunit delta
MPTDRNLIKKEVSTYASALLAAVASDKEIFSVGGELEEVVRVIIGNPTLRKTLDDTTVDASIRAQIVGTVFEGVDTSLIAVLKVMAERGDATLLLRVSEAYNVLAEEQLKATFVTVVTAIELDDELRTLIKKKLSVDFGTDILLREKVDASILGGIILSAHGKRIDASVTSQLENARVVLSTMPTGGER